MSDRTTRDLHSRSSRIGVTGAVLLLSAAASAALGTFLPAGLGLTFALWQAIAARQPAPAPARAARHRR